MDIRARAMSAYAALRRSGPFLILLGLACLGRGEPAIAVGDLQLVAVGNGSPAGRCVGAGLNGVLDSIPQGDDRVGSPTVIHGGDNGICETTPAPDDAHLPGEATLGMGAPNGPVIQASADGICRLINIVAPLGNDVIQVPSGRSKPHMLAVAAGADGVFSPGSIATGDDVTTMAICPGADGLMQTTLAGDDELPTASDLCTKVCLGASTCIIPGDDGTLQSSAAALDDLATYISTGPTGISESNAALGDVQGILVGNGFSGTVCIHAGPDGIAQTTLCGNTNTDPEENGITGDVECDDGNGNANDGCNALCQPELCGDGITQPDPMRFEQCDDGNSSNRDDCLNDCTNAGCGDGSINLNGPVGPLEECDPPNPPTCDASCNLGPMCGNGMAEAGEQCDDGNPNNRDDCLNSCRLNVCGDDFVNKNGAGPLEECDDGNTDTGDGCDASCLLEPRCGDGIAGNSPGEECDDGNRNNNDACVNGCRLAACGDRFLQRGIEECEPPNRPTCNAGCVIIHSPGPEPDLCPNGTVDEGEECDDDNFSQKDCCTNQCTIGVCGDGFLRNKCGEASDSDPDLVEECDDGNVTPGDGCSPECTVECGNTTIDGACVSGTVGRPCGTDAACDSALASGDGVCVAEACDPGSALFCAQETPGADDCSASCEITECGNQVAECQEECDLGASNGLAGGGCSAVCARTLVGAREVSGKGECPSAWTLDKPPRDLARTIQACRDGDDGCDQDRTVNGHCTFSVGVCLNRPGIPDCAGGGLISFDLKGINLARSAQAVAAEDIAQAVSQFVMPAAEVPDRCRTGNRGAICHRPAHIECAHQFGGPPGRCQMGTGVLFDELKAASDGGVQTKPCTDGVPVFVSAGSKLRLRAKVRRVDRPADSDTMLLVCLL